MRYEDIKDILTTSKLDNHYILHTVKYFCIFLFCDAGLPLFWYHAGLIEIGGYERLTQEFFAAAAPDVLETNTRFGSCCDKPIELVYKISNENITRIGCWLLEITVGRQYTCA